MIRIDVLPDDVLLEIFHFYLDTSLWHGGKRGREAWESLVHVCRRWRSLVLGSPRRLNLQLWCTPKTPAKDTLDIWPALPLIVEGSMTLSSGTHNIIAALERSNRVRRVFLMNLVAWQLEEVLAAMQVPFPELTDLQLTSRGETLSVIPDSFLDRSAPRLQHFSLSGIPFPGLPKLLLSTTNLVYLCLYFIPHSGYISPEAIVVILSLSSSLELLSLGFQSPQSRPDWERRRLPPLKRSVIPALWQFHFTGVTEYLEELVTHIDTPQLGDLNITFFNQIDFDCPRLAQFINRTPRLRALHEAHVELYNDTARVQLRYWTHKFGLNNLQIDISCMEPDWQLSSIEQVCNSSSSPLSTVEDLYIKHRYSGLVWKNDAIENTLWLQLLRPFTAVRNLYLSKEFAPGIAAALQELVGARITEVLPSLQNIFVEGLEPSGPFRENIGQFVAARQLSDHPIVISVWDGNYGME
jgi:hypothetical protein